VQILGDRKEGTPPKKSERKKKSHIAQMQGEDTPVIFCEDSKQHMYPFTSVITSVGDEISTVLMVYGIQDRSRGRPARHPGGRRPGGGDTGRPPPLPPGCFARLCESVEVLGTGGGDETQGDTPEGNKETRGPCREEESFCEE